MDDSVSARKMKPSHKAIWVVVAVLVIAKLVETAIRVPFTSPSQQAIFGWKLLVFFIALLLLGSGFAHIIGFPGMWEEKVTNRQRIWVPIAIGVVVGAALLAVDHAIGFGHIYAAALGTSPMAVPFPYSVLVQGYAGVCSAILYTLFGVAFSVWFFGTLLLARRWPRATFWVIAVLVSLWEPYMMASQRHWALLHGGSAVAGVAGILALVYGMDVVGAVLLRRYGFTAALVMRVSAVAVWHIIGRI